MNYSKEDFRALFQAKFDYNKWFAMLRDFFKADELRTTAEPISDPADCDKGCYIGAINTSDSYRIGLFYYEIGHSNVARKKVGLRNLVRTFINSKWGQFDAALAVFSDGKHWRLSLISDIKGEATAVKRYTFVFGEKDNLYRTAIERFALIRSEGPSFEVLKKAFSVEALTEEFFGLYKEHYERFCDFIYQNADDRRYFGPEFAQWNSNEDSQKYIRDYVKNLMGRIVFLQFLQKKGWMGVPTDRNDWAGGDPYFMQHLYDYATEAQKEDFLDQVLEPLFFNCLNVLRPNDVFDTNVNGIGTVKVPYLNGELFEQKEEDKAQSKFPKKYFHDLLNLFLQYNFTIDENDPNDAEIGVDPEMLGKIFENLLEDNKDKGAFYTPKEIVRYMCKESLISYLCSNNGVEHADSIKTLVNNHQLTDKLQEDVQTCECLNKHLRNVKVCDPAIGSGAFPMGLMNEIFACRSVLHENIEETDEETSGQIKREIIQNNIYGVDIEQGAVDIARLRFWLALVVDSVKPEPLPNLDYKIMQGNSLVESYKGLDLSNLLHNNSLFVAPKAEELGKYMKRYFRATDNEEKRQLRENIDFAVKQCIDAAGIKDTVELPNTDFFLWHTYFHDVFKEGGFDIVIGNPPYLRIQGIRKSDFAFADLLGQTFTSATGSFDLYVCFAEQALNMIQQKGVVNFIMPVKWTNAAFGKGLRKVVASRKAMSRIINFSEYQVFNASTYTGLQWFIPESEHLDYNELKSDLKTNDELNTYLQGLNDFGQIDASSLTSDAWVLTQGAITAVLQKLNEQPRRVSDVFSKIFQGLATSKDPVYFLNHCREENDIVYGWSAELDKEVAVEKGIVRPLLKGDDVHRYDDIKTERVVIFPYERKPDSKVVLMKEDYLSQDFPKAYSYLKECEDVLKAREHGRFDIKGEWFQFGRKQGMDAADNEKLVAPDISMGGNFAYDVNGQFYQTTTIYGYLRKEGVKDSYKFLLALLNSTLCWRFLVNTGTVLANGYFRYKPDYIKPFPIPAYEAVQNIESRITTLVDNILYSKRLDPSADTTADEQEIDRLVYHLYGLTYDEVKIVDPETPITEEEYTKEA